MTIRKRQMLRGKYGMNEILDSGDHVISVAVVEIGEILEQSRKAVAVQVNQALAAAIGR